MGDNSALFNNSGRYVPPNQAPRQFQTVRQEDLDEERAREAMLIAQEARQIKEIMGDLNPLLNDQGEMLMNIDENIEASADKVTTANVQLGKALERQKSARRKKLMCFFCFLICIVILIIIIWNYLPHSSSH